MYAVRKTHFDILVGSGGNAHCLPIRVSRSWNLVEVKGAIVLGKSSPAIRLPVFPAKLWMSMTFARVLTSSVPPHFIFAPKILRIHLLNQMNYWTIGPILTPCAQSRKLEKRRHVVWPWCIIIPVEIFFLELPIYQWELKQVWQDGRGGGALSLCSPPESMLPTARVWSYGKVM